MATGRTALSWGGESGGNVVLRPGGSEEGGEVEEEGRGTGWVLQRLLQSSENLGVREAPGLFRTGSAPVLFPSVGHVFSTSPAHTIAGTQSCSVSSYLEIR